MLLLSLAALAAPPPADPIEARLAVALREAARLHERGAIDTFRFRTPHALDPDGLSVTVLPAPGVDDVELAARLEAAGYPVEARAGGLVQAWVPYGALRDVAAIEGVARVREPRRATTKEARVTEGYAATMVTDWHAQGVRGRGATVGIIDVGFSGLDSLDAEELPSDLVLDDRYGSVETTDHGTAVTEVIVDFAPAASYQLATFSTDAEFCEVIDGMVDGGADVINASIGFDNMWHADGNSPVTRCADSAVERGVMYFAAAGNENDKYRVGGLSYVDAEGTIALEGADYVEARTLYGYMAVSFRWSEAFGGAGEDIDIAVFNSDDTLCGTIGGTEYQTGDGDPYELVTGEGCTDIVYVFVYSEGAAADLTGLTGYLYSYYGLARDYWTDTEDLTLPGDLHDGLSIGAYYPDDDSIAEYSSRGPTNDGRVKPDLVGPTGVSTRTYGWMGFDGSSAATPHAAGLGALWVSATGYHGAPAQMRAWMIANARDLGEPGEDNESGAGAISADAIPEGICGGCDAGGGAGIGAALAGLVAVARRRRR